MIRRDDLLSLSARDKRRWLRITGFEPTGIRSVADLRRYVEDCKQRFVGDPEDARFLRWMMDAEFQRYVEGEDAQEEAACPTRPQHIGLQKVKGTLRALDGDRAALEHELVRLIVLGGKAAEPRVAELAAQLQRRADLRIVKPPRSSDS